MRDLKTGVVKHHGLYNYSYIPYKLPPVCPFCAFFFCLILYYILYRERQRQDSKRATHTAKQKAPERDQKRVIQRGLCYFAPPHRYITARHAAPPLLSSHSPGGAPVRAREEESVFCLEPFFIALVPKCLKQEVCRGKTGKTPAYS